MTALDAARPTATTDGWSRDAHYIGGTWRRPDHGRRLHVVSPVTEERIGSAPDTSQGDLDAAVSAARGALIGPWGAADPADRAAAMRSFADELERRAEGTAVLVSAENGMPITLARVAEGAGPVAVLRYYAGLAEAFEPEDLRPAVHGLGSTIVRRVPVGVVGAIVPWNYPQSLTMHKLAPALAAGCTVVIKPAPETALDAFRFADAAEAAGLPAGVLNVVPGGREVGEALVAHPGVDKIAFTGSTPAGRAIGEVCGRLLKPATLELGGKSAAIVLDDADLVDVVRGLSWASLLHAGQTCYMSTRILAPAHRYAEVVDAVAGLAASLPVGDPADPATRVGPLTTARQRELVETAVEHARAEGGRVVTGGRRPVDRDRGWFYEPTVVADLDPGAALVRDEVFGPVLAVLPYSGVDEAVALANDSRYGLAGTVWTADVDRGVEVARRLATGSVGVNFFALDAGAPFGGWKDSGIGQELGPEGLESYVRYQSVYTRRRAADA